MQKACIPTNVVSSNHVHDDVHWIQQYVIQFASDLQQVRCSPVSITNITDHHDITEILLKMVLNTKTLTHDISGLLLGNSIHTL